jgi:hypothetical protein
MSNGIEENELLKAYKTLEDNIDPIIFNTEKLETIELAFVTNLKSLKYFEIFKKLKEINIIACEISLDGLDNLPETLSVLRLVNCGISEINKNFCKLINLETLSLGENYISEIKNINNCVRLKSLQLYSNKISKIEFLQDCLLLEELNLADNQITKIENLDSLSYLKDLNLAANRIESLNNVSHIKYLHGLRILKLNDENFGDNNVCELTDYEYVILKLNPRLEILDFKNIKNDPITFDYFSRFNEKSSNLDKKIHQSNYLLNQELKFCNNFELNTQSYSGDEIQTPIDVERLYLLFQKEAEDYKIDQDNVTEHIDLFEESFKKDNTLLEMYLDFMIYINKSLYQKKLPNDHKIQILDLEYINQFYEKYFPNNFVDITNSFPLIVLRFNPVEDNFNDSYITFSNYSYIIIDDIIKDNVEFILEGLINNYNRLIAHKSNKMRNILDHNITLDKFALLVYSVKDNNIEIKYLIYLFSIDKAAAILTSDCYNLGHVKRTYPNDEIVNIYVDLISIDEKIRENEYEIEELIESNNIMLKNIN